MLHVSADNSTGLREPDSTNELDAHPEIVDPPDQRSSTFKAPQKPEQIGMHADPVGQALARASPGVGVVRGPHRRDEQLHGVRFAGDGIDDVDGGRDRAPPGKRIADCADAPEPALRDLDGDLNLSLVLRVSRPRREDRGAVMARHLGVGSVETGSDRGW